MLGAFFALCAAATFGFNSATVRRGVLTGTVFQAMAITVPIGAPLFLLAALMMGQFSAIVEFGWTGTGYLALAGILHFVWGRYWNYRAVRDMGANLSGAVQQVSLIAALAFAMVLLDEKLTVLRLIGVILIVMGPFVMTAGRSRPKGKDGKNGEGFQPKMMAGWFAALMATLGYALSPTLVRAGLADTGASLAGGRGTVIGVLGGVLLLTIMGNVFNLVGIPVWYQQLIKGALILIGAAAYVVHDRRSP